MPKLKPTPQKEIEEQLVKNIRALGNFNGYRYDKEIAKRVHIPKSTFGVKMNDPRTFKVSDLVQIALAFRVPITALFDENMKKLQAQ